MNTVVGVIGRPHGVRGEVAVDLRTDEPERRFAPGQILLEEGGTRHFTVRSLRTVIGALAGDQDVRVDFVDVDRLTRRSPNSRRR